MNKENIVVSAEVKTFLMDLYNQIEYELRDDYKDGLEKAQQEIERLNNIINELEKWINEKDKYSTTITPTIYIGEIQTKLKELKEGK